VLEGEKQGMLDELGRFGFGDEILDLVEGVWSAYQEAKGCPGSRMEQLVGLAYIVAALRQDVDGIWSQLVASPELAHLNLKQLLGEELGVLDKEVVASLRTKMQQRGWLT